MTTGRPPCDVAATSLGEGEGDPSVRVRKKWGRLKITAFGREVDESISM
jgi:hypothetical protein